jgi:hypothetical protein
VTTSGAFRTGRAGAGALALAAALVSFAQGAEAGSPAGLRLRSARGLPLAHRKCPSLQMHRDKMAKFLSNSFNLPLYAP